MRVYETEADRKECNMKGTHESDELQAMREKAKCAIMELTEQQAEYVLRRLQDEQLHNVQR